MKKFWNIIIVYKNSLYENIFNINIVYKNSLYENIVKYCGSIDGFSARIYSKGASAETDSWLKRNENKIVFFIFLSMLSFDVISFNWHDYF